MNGSSFYFVLVAFITMFVYFWDFISSLLASSLASLVLTTGFARDLQAQSGSMQILFEGNLSDISLKFRLHTYTGWSYLVTSHTSTTQIMKVEWILGRYQCVTIPKNLIRNLYITGFHSLRSQIFLIVRMFLWIFFFTFCYAIEYCLQVASHQCNVQNFHQMVENVPVNFLN